MTRRVSQAFYKLIKRVLEEEFGKNFWDGMRLGMKLFLIVEVEALWVEKMMELFCKN